MLTYFELVWHICGFFPSIIDYCFQISLWIFWHYHRHRPFHEHLWLTWVPDHRPFNDSLYVTLGLCESLWLAARHTKTRGYVILVPLVSWKCLMHKILLQPNSPNQP